MTTPSDVPDDVWEAALEARKQWANGPGDIALACARAIMAERERCARVVQNYGSISKTIQDVHKTLAAAIRGATP